jgi:hypothetical protein
MSAETFSIYRQHDDADLISDRLIHAVPVSTLKFPTPKFSDGKKF